MENLSTPKWYAIKAHPLQEEKAFLNLLMQGIEVYFPKIIKKFWRKGKKVELLKPLFPGNIFAKFPVETHYRKVSYTRGVSKIVSFGGFPIPLEDEEIEVIKAREENGVVKLEDRNFSEGEKIKVVRGPFNGIEGVFVRELDDKERVEVLLKFLYAKARIVLDKDFIEKK